MSLLSGCFLCCLVKRQHSTANKGIYWNQRQLFFILALLPDPTWAQTCRLRVTLTTDHLLQLYVSKKAFLGEQSKTSAQAYVDFKDRLS